MAKSRKPVVVEHLFDQRWDAAQQRLRNPMVTLDEVQAAIDHCNANLGTDLSSRNPANFFKDIIRGANSSRNWPIKIAKHKITGRQATGQGNAFEFVPYSPGQTEPFPDLFLPDSNTLTYKLQALSMPRYARELGRTDESWLVQTVVNLKLIENHFAITSLVDVVEVTHLQMSVKLSQAEIDSIYLAHFYNGSSVERAIITCEAKQRNDPILEQQIVKQVKAAFKITDVDTVIPVGLRAIKGRGMFVIEFAAVSRQQADTLQSLTQSSQAIYKMEPPVVGME